MSRYTREISVAAAYILLLVVLAVAAPSFYRGDKLQSILVASAPVLVAAAGMTLVILTRQIDISIGSQLSVCGIACGLLAASGVPMPLVGLLTVTLGGLFGAINGGLVAGLGLPSIVVTLATLVILREGLRWAREGAFVRNLPNGFQWFGLGDEFGPWALVAAAVAVFGLLALGLRYLAAGRALYATGSDPDAAFLAGLAPRRVTFGAFAALGALTGLAALLNAVRFPDCDPNAGNGLEMQVIAAVVVGGVAISGGRGTLVGPLFGVLLLGTIGSALLFLGSQPYWEKTIQGAIILIAVATDSLVRGRRQHV